MTNDRDANVGLLRQLYEGLESRSVGPIAAALHPDVELHVTGTAELDGTYVGRAAVVAWYEMLLDSLEPGFRVPDHEVLMHDVSLVVAPAGAVRAGDASRGVDIYHFASGLISEIWITPWV